MRIASAVVTIAALTACLAEPPSRLADCDALAEEQPDCMDDEAMADCIEANDTCAETGEVEVGESCPLTFTCYQEGSI